MAVICDTSYLVALANTKESHHSDCVATALNVRGAVIVPVTVVPEAAYMVFSRYGHRSMRRFLHYLQSPIWQIEGFDKDDLKRVHEILEQYKDAKLDFVDASIVAIAERLAVETVLTLDRRDFSIIRPKHAPHFNILP